MADGNRLKLLDRPVPFRVLRSSDWGSTGVPSERVYAEPSPPDATRRWPPRGAKDLIIRGGFNVYPREVEEIPITHPAVSLAAVVGVPHDSHGEEVKAFVIPEPGTDVTGDQLVAWAREQMASYKYPRFVELVETLPMTATGKILASWLRAPLRNSWAYPEGPNVTHK